MEDFAVTFNTSGLTAQLKMLTGVHYSSLITVHSCALTEIDSVMESLQFSLKHICTDTL